MRGGSTLLQKLMRIGRDLLHRLAAACALPPLWAVGVLPPAAALRIAEMVGLAVWLLSPGRRRVVRRNLDIAFGEALTPEARETITRRTFINAVKILAGLSLEWHGKPPIEFRGLEAAKRVLEPLQGRPIAVLTAHVGNWEMGHACLNMLGFPVAAVTQKVSNPYIDRALNRARSHRGRPAVDRAGALVRVHSLLQEGQSIGLLVDQNDRRRRHFYDFFGIPASTNSGFARVLLNARCPIVFAVCCWVGRDWRFEVEATVLRTGDEPIAAEGEPERLVADYLTALERVVRAAPDQYFWLHRRWKSRPKGEPGLYHDLEKPLNSALRAEVERNAQDYVYRRGRTVEHERDPGPASL